MKKSEQRQEKYEENYVTGNNKRSRGMSGSYTYVSRNTTSLTGSKQQFFRRCQVAKNACRALLGTELYRRFWLLAEKALLFPKSNRE